MAIDRIDPPFVGTERELLVGFLDWHRATLAAKCEGLTDQQLRTRSVPPSALSLLGLVRHLAEVERSWFRRILAGEDVPLVYSDSGDRQAAFQADGASVEQAFADWRAEVEHARRIEAATPDLDALGHWPRLDVDVSLRWILIHMIEEYARHMGHADFLRETIDGATGD